MNSNYVFVVDADQWPMTPCRPAQARRLLRDGKAAVFRRYPFTIILNDQKPDAVVKSVTVKLDPVLTIQTWIGRFSRWAKVGGLAMELVKFDTQALANPEISGVDYQQGELAGYEVREYLLEKWNRTCAYCDAKNVPLQIEHVRPRASGGSNRVSNLTLACHSCNQRKGARPVEEFLKGQPDRLRRILAGLKAPLKDAAAVNATRWRLYEELKATGLPVAVGSGGRTKFNRTVAKLPKLHWADAAFVGESGARVEADARLKPLRIIAKGQGPRQRAVLNKLGYPIQHRALRPVRGWRTGDLAMVGRKVYRVTPRQKGSFELTGHGKPFGRPENKLRRIHRCDGYSYA